MGQFFLILTFPGIIIHEFSHELFCRFVGVSVKKVCYFRFGNPAGYVIHEEARYFYKAFLITMGPLIFGTLLAIGLIKLSLNAETVASKFVFLWIGSSIAVNCLPSKGDATSFRMEWLSQLKRNIFVFAGLPFVVIVWLLSRLESKYFNLAYVIFVFYIAKHL